MLNSKAIKEDFKYTFLDKVLDFFSPISRTYYKLCRSLAWFKFAWSDRDYDSSYLLKVIAFKLKRMEKEILQDHHSPHKTTNQSLRLCIKLAEKLHKTDYSYFMDLHRKKWGAIDFIKKVDPKNGNTYTTLGIPGLTPKQEKLERSEFLKAGKKDDSLEVRDKRWLYTIMEKYQHHWWS